MGAADRGQYRQVACVAKKERAAVLTRVGSETQRS
jgi:hypothetical protein